MTTSRSNTHGTRLDVLATLTSARPEGKAPCPKARSRAEARRRPKGQRRNRCVFILFTMSAYPASSRRQRRTGRSQCAISRVAPRSALVSRRIGPSCRASFAQSSLPIRHRVAFARTCGSHCRNTPRRRRRRGGAERDRTDDLLLAKQALSQLSYSPDHKARSHTRRPNPAPWLVGLGRLELPTSRLSGVRSNHLSYRPGRQKPNPDPNPRSKHPGRATDPKPCHAHTRASRPAAQQQDFYREEKRRRRSTRPRPGSCHRIADEGSVRRSFAGFLRKEVIQPQVPLRLPCYDFTPVADPTVAGCLHCWLAHRLRVKPTPMV